MLQSALEAAARWYQSSWPDERVAINLSASQLLSKDFARRLQQLLLHYNLPLGASRSRSPRRLLQTGPTIIASLRELREMDVAVADDFGTGY